MEAPRFVCDASLGRLARWIRAAGYVARSPPGRSGASLVEEAAQLGEVLVTSDRRVMQRRAIRHGKPRALRVSTHLPVLTQLVQLMTTLGLERGRARCMTCGGELAPVEKSRVARRIPPRTARWRDEYFVCAGCDRLYWEGTHWRRIDDSLAALGHGRA